MTIGDARRVLSRGTLAHQRRGSTAVGVTALLGLAVACWVVTLRLMNGMDMGVATSLGSFASFAPLWVSMMVAMMLPGAVPAMVRRARTSRRLRTGPLFVVSYLAVWALVGVPVYVVYRPHGTSVAGVVVIAAGLYELTPLKAHFRRRCFESTGSGLEFGLCCLGSSVGLMVVLLAVSVMSVAWMAVIAVLVLAQKVLRPVAAPDVVLGLAIVVLGVLILIDPSSVPGLMAPMQPMQPMQPMSPTSTM